MNPRIGVLSVLRSDGDCFRRVRAFGLGTSQLVGWDPRLWTDELATVVRRQATEAGVRIASFWAGWTGKSVWDFVEGPSTLGLVPRRSRRRRVGELRKAADFAHLLGAPAVITHLGFIPENPSDPLFAEVVEAVKEIALHLEAKGMEFWLETGQETPVTMLRLLQSVGTENLGLNLDPANLILYGKASPVDALLVFGSRVRSVHAKDGLYPTDPMKLGREVKVGEGRVRFPELVRGLERGGFRGEYIIEREISGEEQDRDIRDTAVYLDRLLQEVVS